jgi:F0F1-type ATP synthase beta subunit
LDALEGCEWILYDEFKEYPAEDIYIIGMIDEAIANKIKLLQHEINIDES